MKKMSKKLCIVTVVLGCMMCFFMSQIFASQVKNVPFHYNILATVKNQSIIDTNHQKTLEFTLFSDMQDDIFYHQQKVAVENNTFTIDVSKLSGYQTLTFFNSKNETASFSYFFSNQEGKVDGYELVTGKHLNVFVTTIKEIAIIYTDKETKVISKLENYLNELPIDVLANVKTITLIPFDNTSHIAGTTKDKNIVLYQFSKYDMKTQKNILFHEIAHTWASKLMEKKLIDYSYTKYQEAVKLDNNSISRYSNQFIQEKGKYSEDFADSVAFYFINQQSFSKKYSHRAAFIQSLLQS